MAQAGTNGHDLASRQRRAIPHLVGSASYEAGCRKAGIGRSTLTKWLGQERFINALRAAESQSYREALVTIERATGEAAETLRALLTSDNESIRLRAATELLAFSLKGREAVEVEDRLRALEARLVGTTKP